MRVNGRKLGERNLARHKKENMYIIQWKMSPEGDWMKWADSVPEVQAKQYIFRLQRTYPKYAFRIVEA